MNQVLKSVRVRMTLAAMGVTAAAVGLAGWVLVRSVEDTRIGEVRGKAEAQVDHVAGLLADGVDPEEALQSVGLAQGVIEVRSAEGELLAQTPDVRTNGDDLMLVQRFDSETASAPAGEAAGGSSGTEVLLPDPAALCLFDPTLCGPECVIETRHCDADSCVTDEPRSVRCPVPEAILGRSSSVPAGQLLFQAQELTEMRQTVDTDQGELTVTAAAPVSEVARSVEAVRRSLWVLLPGLVGIVALVGWWLTGRALRPVEAIRLEAEAIGGSTIHRRVPVPGTGDEIGRLARTMNAMLERLDRSARRQRQFVSDASHELRSPLAAIRTDMEVALREGEAADWPGVATAVLQEEGRLETLLADLLVLAADDEGANGLRKAPVDLADLVDEVVEPNERTDGDEIVVSGNASQLRRAIGNLVTNARRHATSRIAVGLTRVDGRVRITVDDDGPGIPAPDRERVFERFTRLDDGRTRDQGGSGLGLAVVRSIVIRHGGRVWADAGPLGGARFTIDLPPG